MLLFTMPVTHDETHHRFVLTLPEGGGDLRYRLHPDGVMEMYHTEVDPGLRGRGAAAGLSAAAFAFARAKGLKVKVTCPYVASWLKRRPEENDLLLMRLDKPEPLIDPA